MSTCVDCGTSLEHRHRNARRCELCRDADPTRRAVHRINSSPEGRARVAEANRRYQATPEGQAAVRRAVAAFLERPGGREAHRAAVRKYSQTPKGRAALRAGRLRYDERQRRKRAALKGVGVVACPEHLKS